MLITLLFPIYIFHSLVSAAATTTTITVPDNIIEEATIRWCPKYDLRPTEDDEIIYITYYRTTTVYWTSWTTVTKCSNNVCSQVATLTTGTGMAPAASDVVDRTTTYTVFSTTTNYYTDWDIIEYFPSTVESTGTSSIAAPSESTEDTISLSFTSTVDESTNLVVTSAPSTSEDDEEVSYVTVYLTTTSPRTIWTTITSCSENRCTLVTSLATSSSSVESIGESTLSEIRASESISTSSETEETLYSLSLEGPATSLDEILVTQISFEAQFLTTTEIGTTTITITSCSDNSCSEVVSVTGVITITDEATAYTTFCPLTSSTEGENASTVSSLFLNGASEYFSSSLALESEVVTSTVDLSRSDSSSIVVVESSSVVIESTENTSSTSESSSFDYSTSLEGPSLVDSVTTSFPVIFDVSTTSQSSIASSSMLKDKSTTTTAISFDESILNYLSSIPPLVNITSTPPLLTTTDVETTVIILSSCSSDVCSQASRTIVLSTLIEGTTVYSSPSAISRSGVESTTSVTAESSFSTTEASSSSIKSSSTYTTIAAVTYVSSTEVATSSESSLEPVVSTKSEVHTTIITITSCEDNSCTEVVHTTGLTTVTEETTIYTTYCSFPTSIEVASSEKPSVSSKAEKVVSFSTLLSPVESSVEFSLSIPPAPYSVVELRTVSYSGVEYSTSLAATVASSESISSIQSHVEKSTSTAKSTSPIKVLKVMTSVAAPTTLFVKDHSAKVIESVTESSRVATTEEATTKTTLKDIKVATSEKPQAPVTTIIFYNTEEESTTTITSTIETASHIEGTELNAPQPTPESVPEYAPQESIIPEDVTLATITTITDSTSLVYTSKESPVVSANPEAPIASTYEGSGVVNIPALAAIVGLLLSLV